MDESMVVEGQAAELVEDEQVVRSEAVSIRVEGYSQSTRNACGCGERCTYEQAAQWAISDATGLSKKAVADLRLPFRVELPKVLMENLTSELDYFNAAYKVL